MHMAPPISAVFIQIDENPNCAAWDGQIFQPRTAPRPITHVRCERGNDKSDKNDKKDNVWCAISGVDEGDRLCPAMACIVEDSGDGACYLVFGGDWGLRLTDESGAAWGVPYMLLPRDGADLRFV